MPVFCSQGFLAARPHLRFNALKFKYDFDVWLTGISMPNKSRKRERKSPLNSPSLSDMIEPNLASRVVEENLNWAKNLMSFAESLRVERLSRTDQLTAEIYKVVGRMDQQMDQQTQRIGQDITKQINASGLISRQLEAVTYSALYRALLANVAPYFVSLRNQVVSSPNLDVAKLSNDLQFASEGIKAFNLAVNNVAQELKEAQLPLTTLEIVRVPQIETQFLREELAEARNREKELAIRLAETEEENVQLKCELAIAKKHNENLIELLLDSERHVQDLEDEKEKSKSPTAN